MRIALFQGVHIPIALQRYALTMNKCLDTNEKNARQSKKIIER